MLFLLCHLCVTCLTLLETILTYENYKWKVSDLHREVHRYTKPTAIFCGFEKLWWGQMTPGTCHSTHCQLHCSESYSAGARFRFRLTQLIHAMPFHPDLDWLWFIHAILDFWSDDKWQWYNGNKWLKWLKVYSSNKILIFKCTILSKATKRYQISQVACL